MPLTHEKKYDASNILRHTVRVLYFFINKKGTFTKARRSLTKSSILEII
jgi:hypothetical protein